MRTRTVRPKPEFQKPLPRVWIVRIYALICAIALIPSYIFTLLQIIDGRWHVTAFVTCFVITGSVALIRINLLVYPFEFGMLGQFRRKRMSPFVTQGVLSLTHIGSYRNIVSWWEATPGALQVRVPFVGSWSATISSPL